MLKKPQIEEFFARLQKANPNPRGELQYINPYTLLVAVVLSAQATDVSVNKATEPLFNIAFGQPTMAVDTHIFRVGNRTGLAPGKDPLAVELQLEKRVPEPYRLHAHHWLILHGRYVCKARKPDCPVCVVNDICQYKAKTVVE